MPIDLSPWPQRRMNEKDSLVYICSPYAAKGIAEVRDNIRRAESYARFVYAQGYLPLCVHSSLDEWTGLHESTGDREELLHLGRRYVRKCDQLWVFGDFSIGMKGEIQEAESIPITIRYFDRDMSPLERYGNVLYPPINKIQEEQNAKNIIRGS